jgi:hypothetical protein
MMYAGGTKNAHHVPEPLAATWTGQRRRNRFFVSAVICTYMSVYVYMYGLIHVYVVEGFGAANMD